jgi:NADH-quinone oxidoreductase subunit J
MSIFALILISIVMLCGALGAALLPRLVHGALSAVLAFVGAACIYLLLEAEFVGLIQFFVYVGAVAILIVFTILLTNPEHRRQKFQPLGMLVPLAVFAALAWCIVSTGSLPTEVHEIEPLTVKRIGHILMDQYVWPLMVIALLLTAALIGALIIVMEDQP